MGQIHKERDHLQAPEILFHQQQMVNTNTEKKYFCKYIRYCRFNFLQSCFTCQTFQRKELSYISKFATQAFSNYIWILKKKLKPREAWIVILCSYELARANWASFYELAWPDIWSRIVLFMRKLKWSWVPQDLLLPCLLCFTIPSPTENNVST